MSGPHQPGLNPAPERVVKILDYGAFADLLIARFYAGEPPRIHRPKPAEIIRAAVVFEVLSPGRSSVYTQYDRPFGPCGADHPAVIVTADHWVQLSLARRLECPCGQVAQIEIFDRPGVDYL
jgi:hypothetical protein